MNSISTKMTFATSSMLSENDQQKLIKKLQVFTINGGDRHGLTLLRIVGKFFAAKNVSVAACLRFLEEEIFPKLGDEPFSALYLNSGVQRGENFPGISALRRIHDAIPEKIKNNLQTIYFLHPGFQSRLFMATFGLIIFTRGLYWKIKYVSRLDLLWDNVKRKEVEIPEFMYEEDEEMDKFPMMIDFGLESDHPRVYQANPKASSPCDSELRLYSLRCIV